MSAMMVWNVNHCAMEITRLLANELMQVVLVPVNPDTPPIHKEFFTHFVDLKDLTESSCREASMQFMNELKKKGKRFVFYRLALAKGVDSCSVMRDPKTGVSVRVVSAYDIAERTVITRAYICYEVVA